MTPECEIYPWKEFSGQLLSTYALPDYNSIYFSYGFDWKNNKTLGLRITGDFGYARYMSYNIYGELEGTSLASKKDVEIQALPFNVNPFLPGIPPDMKDRRYRVHVFCSDTANDTVTNGWENPLTFTASEAPTLLAVVVRYYLPVGSDCANVPLPIIQAVDTIDGHELRRPENLVPADMPKHIFEKTLKPIFETVVDNTLRFYHTPGSGEFNNMDNLYLLNAVDKQPDEVLLLKFQAPTYGANNPDVEVRYWAVNQGNVDTSTPAGMFDEELKPAKDGLTYIAMGDPEDPAIADWAEQGGYNFMPWMATAGRAVILYRNLVTMSPVRFKGSIAHVPKSDFATSPITPNEITRLDAKNWIGSYAPTGQKVTQAEFMRNYGGMPSPGFKS